MWSGKEQIIRTRVSWQECCLKKKYGGLGLVDPEEAKTSMLCKWIVKAMEPGESNLQVMLRYRLTRSNPQRGRSWKVDLEWFICKQHQGFSGSKMWSHISKVWKNMAKSIYQLPPHTIWSYFTRTFDGRMGLNFSRKGLLTLKA